MEIRNATMHEIETAAYNARVSIGRLGGATTKALNSRGDRWQINLAPDRETSIDGHVGSPPRFARRGQTNGRLLPNNLCWHGFKLFFDELFRIAPNARVKTSIATYNGRDDYLAKFGQTANTNIGSIMSPVRLQDACVCNDEVIVDSKGRVKRVPGF